MFRDLILFRQVFSSTGIVHVISSVFWKISTNDIGSALHLDTNSVNLYISRSMSLYVTSESTKAGAIFFNSLEGNITIEFSYFFETKCKEDCSIRAENSKFIVFNTNSFIHSKMVDSAAYNALTMKNGKLFICSNNFSHGYTTDTSCMFVENIVFGEIKFSSIINNTSTRTIIINQYYGNIEYSFLNIINNTCYYSLILVYGATSMFQDCIFSNSISQYFVSQQILTGTVSQSTLKLINCHLKPGISTGVSFNDQINVSFTSTSTHYLTHLINDIFVPDAPTYTLPTPTPHQTMPKDCIRPSDQINNVLLKIIKIPVHLGAFINLS